MEHSPDSTLSIDMKKKSTLEFHSYDQSKQNGGITE